MQRFSPTVILVVLGLLALLVLAAITLNQRSQCGFREELIGTRWVAGSIKHPSEHDVWVEFRAFDPGQPVAIYRDYDGDGVVDEVIQFFGAMTAVLDAPSPSGRMTRYRRITEPLELAKTIPEGETQSGPFTRSQLDELARRCPYGRPR